MPEFKSFGWWRRDYGSEFGLDGNLFHRVNQDVVAGARAELSQAILELVLGVLRDDKQATTGNTLVGILVVEEVGLSCVEFAQDSKTSAIDVLSLICGQIINNKNKVIFEKKQNCDQAVKEPQVDIDLLRSYIAAVGCQKHLLRHICCGLDVDILSGNQSSVILADSATILDLEAAHNIFALSDVAMHRLAQLLAVLVLLMPVREVAVLVDTSLVEYRR